MEKGSDAYDKKNFRNAVARLIARQSLAHNVVESKKFRAMCLTLNYEAEHALIYSPFVYTSAHCLQFRISTPALMEALHQGQSVIQLCTDSWTSGLDKQREFQAIMGGFLCLDVSYDWCFVRRSLGDQRGGPSIRAPLCSLRGHPMPPCGVRLEEPNSNITLTLATCFASASRHGASTRFVAMSLPCTLTWNRSYSQNSTPYHYSFDITLFLSVGNTIFAVSFVLQTRKPSSLPAYLYYWGFNRMPDSSVTPMLYLALIGLPIVSACMWSGMLAI